MQHTSPPEKKKNTVFFVGSHPRTKEKFKAMCLDMLRASKINPQASVDSKPRSLGWSRSFAIDFGSRFHSLTIPKRSQTRRIAKPFFFLGGKMGKNKFSLKTFREAETEHPPENHLIFQSFICWGVPIGALPKTNISPPDFFGLLLKRKPDLDLPFPACFRCELAVTPAQRVTTRMTFHF